MLLYEFDKKHNRNTFIQEVSKVNHLGFDERVDAPITQIKTVHADGSGYFITGKVQIVDGVLLIENTEDPTWCMDVIAHTGINHTHAFNEKRYKSKIKME